MKRIFVTSIFVMTVCSLIAIGFTKETEKSGEVLFKKYCAACHPDGGNLIIPEKSLSAKDRKINKAMAVDDIVKLMRTPGPGMVKFDEKIISEKDARAIAEYILKTFK